MNNTTDNFWNDDLVKEYTHDVIIKALNERTVSPLTWDEQILKFKQSKLQQQKEEQPKRIEVRSIDYLGYKFVSNSNLEYQRYSVSLSDFIPDGKCEGLYNVIERYLNGDNIIGYTLNLPEDLTSPSAFQEAMKKYPQDFSENKQLITLSKEKLDAMMENVWNAARCLSSGREKYYSFNDYQQSLPENKSETQTTSNASIECQNEERIWFVNSYWEVHSKIKNTSHPADNQNNITVKSQEDGERYVLENKPCLTFNEAMICYKHFHYDYSDFKKHLSELVNQKIKQ